MEGAFSIYDTSLISVFFAHMSHIRPLTHTYSHVTQTSVTYTQFNPSPNRVLGVFGLSLYTGEKELRDFFSKYGPMEDLKVIYDHQTGKSRGFAFIYYEDIEDAIDVSAIALC